LKFDAYSLDIDTHEVERSLALARPLSFSTPQSDLKSSFVSTLPTIPHPTISPSINPSKPFRQMYRTSSHHLSSTSSIIGGTAYGQNITTATTGKYIRALPPTFFHCAAQAAWPSAAAAPALAERTAAYVLNCWRAGCEILVRASAESTGERARGDIVFRSRVEICEVCLNSNSNCRSNKVEMQRGRKD